MPQAAATAAPIVYAALGDSITAGGSATAPQFYYANVLGATLGAASTTDLGIPGEFSGPVNFPDNGLQITYGGVLADEVPQIPTNATLVTLYIGTNDYTFLGNLGILPDYSNAMTVEEGVASQYAANIAGIIAGIQIRAPKARIVVATVPNESWRAINRTEPLIARQAGAYLVDAFKSALIATGLTVVDLLCEPGMYDETNFGGPYNVHPNNAGHAIIAADFLAQIAHPTPPGHCQYEGP
jgi:lysophospholipase L1-like esterase